MKELTTVSDQAMSTIDPAALYPLCNPFSYESGSLPPSFVGVELDRGHFQVNPRILYASNTLHAVQASSYCLAACLLSLPSAVDNGVLYAWAPQQPLLHTVEWFKIATPHLLHPDDLQKLVAMLHTAANKAVGFFAVELRSALASKRVIFGNTQGLTPPPTGFDIPFQSLVVNPLPIPFEENTSAAAFGLGHLLVMAHPDFFVSGEWTGYFSHTGQFGIGATWAANPTDFFNGIGGDNADVQANGYDRLNAHYPFLVERSVRFRLVC